MSKLAEQFIKYARDERATQAEFEEAVDYLYACFVDMMLDDAPDSEREHYQVFGGHKLVITSRREFLN